MPLVGQSIKCSRLKFGITVLTTVILFVVAILITYFVTRAGNSTDVENQNSAQLSPQYDGPTSDQMRLPKDVIPMSYDLKLQVYLPGFVALPEDLENTFNGSVTVDLVVLREVKQIALNSKGLKITHGSKLLVDGRFHEITMTDVDERLERVVFRLQKGLPEGTNAKLKVFFSGKISQTLGGLYSTKYKTKDGRERYLAVTHMQIAYARQLVPCFDEPNFKANWTIAITHPEGSTAVSNGMEIKSENIDSTWHQTTFHPTPRMSSYLLAVVISEFAYISKKTSSGTLFRIWSRPDAKNETEYALYAGVKCLEYYEKKFGIPFPMQKQDMMAVPDFGPNAMENWGVVIYRENTLLYTPHLYAPEHKRGIAMMIAHELAHQWFGNLVTLQWWNDVWLNEGFARFMEYGGADEISGGQMRTTEYFLSRSQDASLELDALPTSHPLSSRIVYPKDMREGFSTISYEKGASFVRMLRHTIGDEAFDRAIHHYLTKYSYGNAAANDLYAVLDKHVPHGMSGSDGLPFKVGHFARQWTNQMGFPEVSVSRLNATTLKVTQSHFLLKTNIEEEEKYRNPKFGYEWDVPLWYRTKEDAELKFAWLSRDRDLYLHVASLATPVLNYDSRAFFRVNYEDMMWEDIAEQLEDNHTIYSTKTRTRLISDVFALAEADRLDYSTVFDLIDYLPSETEYMPWNAALAGLEKIESYFGTDPEAKYLKAFKSQLLTPLFNRSSIEHLSNNYLDDSLFSENLLEAAVINNYCPNSPDCAKEMERHFEENFLQLCDGTEMSSDCSKVAVPIRATIYCEGVRRKGNVAWQKIFELSKKENVQVERTALLQALTCTTDMTKIMDLLSDSWNADSDLIKVQDAPLLYMNIGKNPIVVGRMSSLLVDHWEEVYKRYGTNFMNTLLKIIRASTSRIKTDREVQQLIQLQQNHSEARRITVFSQQIAMGQQRVRWMKENYRKMTEMLKNKLTN